MNRRHALPYLLPYVLYVLAAQLPLAPEHGYMLRIVLTGGALAWAARRIRGFTGPQRASVSIIVGVAAGLVGIAAWILLLKPFVGYAGAAAEGSKRTAMYFWLRAGAATLLVPFAEEFALRGFVLRFAVQWDRFRKAKDKDPFGAALDADLHDVEPGAWTWFAVLVSTAAFTLGHGFVEWPAAIVYGALMAGLWIWRKDLLSCVVAHAVSNAALAYYVHARGAWELW